MFRIRIYISAHADNAGASTRSAGLVLMLYNQFRFYMCLFVPFYVYIRIYICIALLVQVQALALRQLPSPVRSAPLRLRRAWCRTLIRRLYLRTYTHASPREG